MVAKAMPKLRMDGSPLKRPRSIDLPKIDVNEAIAHLQRALTTKQRLMALHHVQNLIEGDPTVISWMVDSGLIRILQLQLSYALQRHGSTSQELGTLCQVFDLALRTSPAGSLESALDKEAGRSLVNLVADAFPWGFHHVIVSILHTISQTSSGAFLILHCSKAMHCVTELFRCCRASSTSKEAVFEALGLLKNLTYFSEESRNILLDLPGIVGSLANVAVFVDQKGHERLSAIWRNLSVSMETRRRLAQDPDVLNGLLELADCTCSYALRNLLNTTISLSMDPESCVILVLHGDGIFVNVLRRLLVTETDALIRKRAARVIKLWASNDFVGPILVKDRALMDVLSQQALQDQNVDVRHEAADAFCRCSQRIQSPMPQHQLVLDAIMFLAEQSRLPVEVLARTLKAQALHPRNRIPMAERNSLLSALARIAQQEGVPNTAREDACCALAYLSDEAANLPKLSTAGIVEAVTVNAIGGRGLRRSYAVQTIVNLTSTAENLPKLATHTNLLQALIQFAATSIEDQLKSKVKKVIMMLIAEL